MKRIVVIPSDSLQDYVKNGISEKYIKDYYNPGAYYDEVYVVSPLEKGITYKYGMIIIGVKPSEINRVIKKINPDIIRAYDGFKCADWLVLAKTQGIPTVCSVHDSRNELIHQSLKYADLVVCMSDIVKQKVFTLVKGIDINRVVVMPNRIDTELFKKRVDKEFENKMNQQYQKKYHIIHVGRKTEEKNIDTVIKAMKFLSDEYEVIFIGRGNREPYEKLAIEEGVENKCHFVDSVANDELPFWYSWCDCMCTPSRCEGFGFVFIEAAGCEASIITSDIAPMNEYLCNNKSAYLVKDFENPEIIAMSIRNACLCKNYSITQEARRVACEFSKEKIDKIEIEIMKNVCKKETMQAPKLLVARIILKYNFEKYFRKCKLYLYNLRKGR